MNPPNRLKTVAITAAATTVLAVGAGALCFGVKPLPNQNTAQSVNVNGNAANVPEVVDLKIKGNKQSRIYHLKGCPNYNDIAERNIVWFKTREEAEARKFRMARNC